MTSFYEKNKGFYKVMLIRNVFISVYFPIFTDKTWSLTPMWALPKRVRVIWDVSPVPLGSKESHEPPIVSLRGWLRAKSPYLIMIEHKMSGMKV